MIFPYFYSYNKTKYDTKSQRWYPRKLVPLKISALNCFGVCTDSQNRGNSVDHHIYIPTTIFGLSKVFCFCCTFVSVVTLLCFAVISLYFAMGFSLFCREFSLFSRRFLYSAVAFFILPWVFFILPWVFFILPWVFFILPRFLYSAVSVLYFAVTLFMLPWL